MIMQTAQTLENLLRSAQVEPEEVIGSLDTPVASLSDHSREIGRHGLFLARRGSCTDSNALVEEAARQGAAAAIIDRPRAWIPGMTLVRVKDARRATGQIAHAFYGHPARRLIVSGITGTDGKTSVSLLAEAIFQAAGMRVGLIGTLEYRWPNRVIPAGTTTPSSLQLASMFAEMERDGVHAVVMEVSSHAIDQERIAGIPFRAAALTGVASDHLDYHGDLAAYIAVKRRLFTERLAEVPGSVAVLNADDPVGEELLDTCECARFSFSAQPDSAADARAADIRFTPEGTTFRLILEGRAFEIQTRLVGMFNVSNILAAAGIAHSLGVDGATIAEGVRRVRVIPGRFENISAGQEYRVIVDFGHTASALENALRSARRITEGRLITVLGCGGRRDVEKRARMGAVAGKYSDYVIITNDNTRGESPERIARQIQEGALNSGLRASRLQTLLDRRQAIDAAIQLAQPGDTVVIAGRGAERFQDLGDQVIALDDREVAAEAIRRRLQEPRAASLPALAPVPELCGGGGRLRIPGHGVAASPLM